MPVNSVNFCFGIFDLLYKSCYNYDLNEFHGAYWNDDCGLVSMQTISLAERQVEGRDSAVELIDHEVQHSDKQNVFCSAAGLNTTDLNMIGDAIHAFCNNVNYREIEQV